MKRFFFFIVIIPTLLLSQEKKQQNVFPERSNSFGLFAGMGIHLVRAADIVDYINSTAQYSQRVDDFATAVDFFGGVEFPIGEEWGIKIEYSHLFKSYTFLGRTGGTYEFFYSVNAPTLVVQKVIPGNGYFVKFGAGGGYHIGNASQKFSFSGMTTQYSASGIGIKIELVGQTAFDENFFGYIAGTLGWEFVGELKDDNGAALVMPATNNPVSLNYFHAGLRFGIMYYF